ncbi:MAG: DUF5658 family protein [Haloarculaceae archaeon]
MVTIEAPRADERSIEHWSDYLDAVEYELWLLVLVALTADVYLTYRGLQAGLSEVNPLMRAAFETVGFAVLGLAKAVVLGVAGLTREIRPEYGPIIPLGLSIPWVVATVVNVALLF